MSKQKVFIDGLGLVDGHFSGIGQYTLGILKGLDQIIEREKYTNPDLPEIIVVLPRDTLPRFKSFGFKNIGYKRLPFTFRYIVTLWLLGKMFPVDLWCGKGVYIFPRFVSMPLLFSKSAMVIYDISFELFREYSDENNARFLSEGIKRSLKTTGKVITISDNARKEIIDFYKLPENKVVVATPAVDETQFYRRTKQEIEEVKRKYNIKGDYILALSNLEPRKNLDGLVDAYCKLPESVRKDTGLLLVGVNGWKIEKLFAKIVGKVEKGFNIMRPSHYVADEDKPAIISGAKLLVYPSHYEGFGIPPLEALACGVPVVTANNSSLPEVVGNVGTMINSKDIAAITKAITDSLRDHKTLSKKMQIEGPNRAREFSWEKSSRVFLDVVSELRK